MTPILDRIRSKCGEVTRDRWTISLRRGRLDAAALAWIKDNRPALMREVWAEYDDWEERAAIREFDGGQAREEANDAAYDEVMARREREGWTHV